MSVLICAATVTTFIGAAVCGTAVFAYGAGKELESKKFEKYQGSRMRSVYYRNMKVIK